MARALVLSRAKVPARPTQSLCKRGRFCATILVMRRPAKNSDERLLDTRVIGEILDRSIAGQIEVKPLSACLATVDSPEGRRRVSEYLDSLPFPHYEPAPGKAGRIVRIDESGRRTAGRFIQRRFKAGR